MKIKLFAWVVKLFTAGKNKKDDHKEFRLKIINYVNVIKAAVNSDVVNLIVSLTNTKTDDKIQKWIIQQMDVILREAQLSNRVLVEESLQEAIKRLKKEEYEIQAKKYAEIAGRLYLNATGGESLAEATTAIQVEYKATPGGAPSVPKS